MRRSLLASICAAIVLNTSAARADDSIKTAPGVVLKSADGKHDVDLAKLFSDGPVLVRLTCACSGCDKELPQFQKLQAAYDAKGLRTVAVFKEKADTAEFYANNMHLKCLWLADPKGQSWKVFGATAMPTNILIDKGGRVVKTVAGCTPDGKNAQEISAAVAKLLKAEEAKVAETTTKK
jgi:peroxiredoxin